MNRTLACLVALVILLSSVIAIPRDAAAVTDDMCTIMSPTSANAMGLCEVRIRVTIGSNPLDGGHIRIVVPDGWSTPQTDNSSAEGYTEVIMSIGAFGSVSSVACDGMNVTAMVDGAISGDIIYVKYGSGGLARAPFVLGLSNFTVEVSRGSGFEPATGSPMPLMVETGGFSDFRVLLPGETAADGTVEGKTGTPLPIAAGQSIMVEIHTVDAGNNLVAVNSSGDYLLMCSDVFRYPPGGLVTALNFVDGIVTVSVTWRIAGDNWLKVVNQTLVEYGFVELNVGPGAPVGLQVLLPGVSAVPGDVSGGGEEGTPISWLAGLPYPFEARVVDAYFNINATVERAINVTVLNGNSTVGQLNGATTTGICEFETMLVDPTSYVLTFSSPALPVTNVTTPVLRIGRLQALSADVQGEIDGGPFGPFSFRVIDNTGVPFEGANVSFSFSATPAGFSLEPSYALTDSSGVAGTYATTGSELGNFTVMASCGMLPGSPAAMTLRVVDLTPPTADITTLPGTVGPSFTIDAEALDIGGGDVSAVELWYRTGLVWYKHSERSSPPWAFNVSWSEGSGVAEFSVLAADDQGNRQEDFAGTLALTVDADAPMLVHGNLPGYSRPHERNVVIQLSEEIGTDGHVEFDGTDMPGLVLSHPDNSSVSFTLDLSTLEDGPHEVALDGFADRFGNMMGRIAMTVIVDGTVPSVDLCAELPLDGSPLGAGTLPISWSARDEFGLRHFKVGINGDIVDLNGESGAASVVIPDGADAVELVIIAVDLAGNTNEKRIGPVDVDLTPPTVSPPTYLFIPQTGNWHFSVSADDDLGLSTAYLLYRNPGGTDFLSKEMAPSAVGFTLMTALDGLRDAEVAVEVRDSAYPPNVARYPASGVLRVTAPDPPGSLAHSQPSSFIPGKPLVLTLQSSAGVDSALLLWGHGAGYTSVEMESSLAGWTATIVTATIVPLEYYFIVLGHDGASIVENGDGTSFKVSPRVPIASMSSSNPSEGVVEVVFPVPMDRASVEDSVRLSSDADISWREDGESDVLVVRFAQGIGEGAVTVDDSALTSDGYAMESDYTAVCLAPDSQGESPAPCLALGVIAVTLFALLAAAGVGLRFTSERGRYK